MWTRKKRAIGLSETRSSATAADETVAVSSMISSLSELQCRRQYRRVSWRPLQMRIHAKEGGDLPPGLNRRSFFFHCVTDGTLYGGGWTGFNEYMYSEGHARRCVVNANIVCDDSSPRICPEQWRSQDLEVGAQWVWGTEVPQRGPGAEPLVEGSGGKPPESSQHM